MKTKVAITFPSHELPTAGDELSEPPMLRNVAVSVVHDTVAFWTLPSNLKEEVSALAMVLTRFWTSEHEKNQPHQEVIDSSYDVLRHVADLEASPRHSYRSSKCVTVCAPANV